MFTKLCIAVASVLITLASAMPDGSPPPPVIPPTSNQCCTSVGDSASSAFSEVAALLGLNVPVGLGCSPITVVGAN
ncbi:hypothetical protein B0H12DRAFT_1237167 [Mycena haematopus]|nr:hypothetical protein B0H12DRAFT_1237167 [Mycena haematopus]